MLQLLLNAEREIVELRHVTYSDIETVFGINLTLNSLLADY